MTSAVTNFWCHKLITIVHKKEQWHGKFYLQFVWRKTPYFKHRKYQNLFAFSFISAEYMHKIDFFISQGSAVTFPKVRWLLSYAFCSKFHTLSSNAKIWKSVKTWQSYREIKGKNFFETQCSVEQVTSIATSDTWKVWLTFIPLHEMKCQFFTLFNLWHHKH